MKRPDGVMLVGVYHFVRAALLLLSVLGLIALPFIVGVLAQGDRDAILWTSIASAACLVFVGLAFLANLIIGFGLLRMKEWGRIFALILAIFRLFSFPVGTLTGSLVIMYLMQERVAGLFRQ